MDVYGRYGELVFMGVVNQQHDWGAPSCSKAMVKQSSVVDHQSVDDL